MILLADVVLMFRGGKFSEIGVDVLRSSSCKDMSNRFKFWKSAYYYLETVLECVLTDSVKYIHGLGLVYVLVDFSVQQEPRLMY
jgi:hypothetical protein